MIQIKNISLSFSAQTIFDDISCAFREKQHIGVVGRNGAGKSTLLKIIANLIQPDDGYVSIERDKKLAYMPQEVVILSEKTVLDEAYSVFDYYIKLQEEKVAIEEKLEAGADDAQELLERYSWLQEELLSFDAHAALMRTEKILFGLGFNELTKLQPVNELSEGWKMRLVLAKLLLQEADFYLFDEPTNHLDMVTKEWFFDFLKHGDFGFLLVTHDRYFLEKACDYIFELERGNGTLYNGNFSKYLALKEQQRAVSQSAYERQQKDIDRKQATIDRFKAKASKARMAQSMMKQLEKIELVEVEPPLPSIKISFPPMTRSGAVVLSVKNISHSFGDRTIFQNVSCEIQRGEKVAIVAPNGTGKTTFFNTITGKLRSATGSVSFGHNVDYAVFEQDQMKALTLNNTIIEEIMQACAEIPEALIRRFLGAFLFSGDDIYKKISVLSGGERNRVAMVKVLLQKANFLLLDEPTNHLDLYAKEVLLQALQQYEGTILIVSHDHDFLNKLATRILELTPEGMNSYVGNYESYLDHKKQSSLHDMMTAKNAQANRSQSISSVSKNKEVKETGHFKKELSFLEVKIMRLEKKIQEIYKLFEQHEYGSAEYEKLVIKLKSLQEELVQATQEWENNLES